MIEDESTEDERPSKSQRKRDSHDLQALGEELIRLPQSELDALPLPEKLRDAVDLARKITQHGGLYRQKQYIGKLMRKYDAEPIRVAMAARHERESVEALRFRRIEQWRDRMISEGAAAIASFVTDAGADANVAQLQSLVEQVHREQQSGAPPKAARALFRAIREALGSD